MEPKKMIDSEPIVISIQNLNGTKQKWNLFGFNKFNGKKRLGNEEHVEISGLGSLDYSEIFNNTSGKKILIGRWRISTNLQKNLHQQIFKHSMNINGHYSRKPINLGVMIDSYQFQSNIIDMTSKWKITGERHLSGTIEPNSTIVISLYPQIKGKKIPRLSGKNVAPVIIQTSVFNKKPVSTKKKVAVKKSTVKPSKPTTKKH